MYHFLIHISHKTLQLYATDSEISIVYNSIFRGSFIGGQGLRRGYCGSIFQTAGSRGDITQYVLNLFLD